MNGRPGPAGSTGSRRSWLVSVDLPIEAGSPAEAVAEFWSCVHELGSAQLPVYVAPFGQELQLQAYLGDAPTNLDPEEDE